MHYVIWDAARHPRDWADPALRLLARGESLVLEGPWPLGETALGYVADTAPLAALRDHAGAPGIAYAVEGIEEPGDGAAFVIAAHKMLDAEGFRPYAEAIPGMLGSFGVRSLARGGKVTLLAGEFAPDRAVVLEFASVEAAVDFYTSAIYAPLLQLRLRTTDPRFLIVSRDGVIAAGPRARAAQFLRAGAQAR